MNFIKKHIHSFFPSISEKSANSFIDILSLKKLSKNEFLDSKEYFFILKSGVVKSLSNKENLKTKDLFIAKNSSNIISNLFNIPITNYSFKSITDIEFYACNYNDFLKLVKNNLEISTLENKLLEHKIIIQENKLDNLMTKNTRERYLSLIKEIPNLEKLIPKYEIASYLNITPVQLTRIRKNV